MQVIGRSQGRSVVAAAAYRAGERLVDEGRGAVADFSGRRGVIHAEILAPEGSAPWLRDRQTLWNAVERMERRSDAQLAREFNIALPHQATDDERLALVRGFVRDQFVARGMVADIAIHRPIAEKGDDPRNFHAHVMLTLRRATAVGLAPVKTREWNSVALLEEWRAQWARYHNVLSHLPAVDHRRLEAQREAAKQRGDRLGWLVLNRAPEVHVGPRARAMVARGRLPVSRNHTSRPKANAGRTTRETRVVRYPMFDTGSRVVFNLDRISRNIAQLDRSIMRYQAAAARTRVRQHIIGRRRLCGLALAPAPVRRRETSLAAMIAELARLVSGLLDLQQKQLRRRSDFMRAAGRRRALQRYRSGGHRRHRSRMFP